MVCAQFPAPWLNWGRENSIGVGLAAMLCGVNNYYALDVIEYSNIKSNLRVFDELLALFTSRAGSPTKGWPDYDNFWDAGLFPSHILHEDLLRKTLDERRISKIRRAITNMAHDDDDDGNAVTIRYMVPWSDRRVIKKNTVDLIISHAALEHVVDIKTTYQSFHLWLKPDGFMSHQIDFTSHGLSDLWNGYWGYSEFLWKTILGRRPYLINRLPHSAHIDCMKQNGFLVICDLTRYRQDGLRRSELSAFWKNIADNDLTCSEAFIQANKSDAVGLQA